MTDKPQVDITIDIIDVWTCVVAEFQRQHPTLEVNGITVKSFNYTVLKIKNMKLIDPVLHALHPQRATMEVV